MKKLFFFIIFMVMLSAAAWAAPADYGYYSLPLKIGGTDATPTTQLEIDGAIKLGNGAETCSGVAGAMVWNGTNFQGCDGTSWSNFTLDTTTPPTNITAGNTSVTTADTGSDGTITLSTEGATRATITNDGKMGIGTASPITRLDINGSLKLGDGDETCNSTYVGTIRYNATTTSHEYCNGTSWIVM